MEVRSLNSENESPTSQLISPEKEGKYLIMSQGVEPLPVSLNFTCGIFILQDGPSPSTLTPLWDKPEDEWEDSWLYYSLFLFSYKFKPVADYPGPFHAHNPTCFLPCSRLHT